LLLNARRTSVRTHCVYDYNHQQLARKIQMLAQFEPVSEQHVSAWLDCTL
jgi:hypothetical protein